MLKVCGAIQSYQQRAVSHVLGTHIHSPASGRDGNLHLHPCFGKGTARVGPPGWCTRPASAEQSEGPYNHHSTIQLRGT